MRLFVFFQRACLGQKLSLLGRRFVAAEATWRSLLWLPSFLWLLLLWPGVARGFDPADVPDDFRATFVNCLSKAQADPMAGWDYAEQWLSSGYAGTAYAQYCMAMAAFRAGEPGQAGDMLVALSGFDRVHGTDLEVRFLSLAGDLLDAAGRAEAAVQAHSEALKLEPDDPVHWVSRAVARASLGDFEATLADLDRALDLDPERVDALVFRGSAYRAVGENDLAMDDALQALLVEPENLPGLWLAADLAIAEGDQVSAKAFLQRIRDSQDAGWRAQAEALLADLAAD